MRSTMALVCSLFVCLACGPVETGGACSPDTCRGCCDGDGVCQLGNTVDACGAGGAMCSSCGGGQVCAALGACLATWSAPVDAGVTVDAGVMVDAGAFEDSGVDAGVDAGSPCAGGLVENSGFECGLGGWRVLEGTGALSSLAAEGSSALAITADAQGRARVARAQSFRMPGTGTLCLAVSARGTVPTVRLEALVTSENRGVSFGAPVTSSWARVPPSYVAVPVVAGAEVLVIVRAFDALAGQRLEVDALEALLVPGACPTP